MQADVETFAFMLGFDPQTHQGVDHLEDDGAGNRAVDDGCDDTPGLGGDLAGIAFEQTRGSANSLGGEDAGQQPLPQLGICHWLSVL